MYDSKKLDDRLNHDIHPRTYAFEEGPSTPLTTWNDPYSYSEDTLPLIEPGLARKVILPTPTEGQTHNEATVALPPGKGPIGTNLAVPLFTAKVSAEGMQVVARNKEGPLVLSAPAAGQTQTRITVTADAGSVQAIATVLCLVGALGLVGYLALSSRRPASYG